MLVTLSVIVTSVSPLQPENALFPMLVTLLPSVTLVRVLLFLNASLYIAVQSLSITRLVALLSTIPKAILTLGFKFVLT